MYLRIYLQGRLNKPIAPAVQTKLSAAQTLINEAVTYSRKINANLLNEETPHAIYDNQPNWIDFDIDLIVPEYSGGTLILFNLDPDTEQQVGGIKVASAIVPKLVTLRNTVRGFRQYLTNTDKGRVVAELFICHHDDVLHLMPDEPRQEI